MPTRKRSYRTSKKSINKTINVIQAPCGSGKTSNILVPNIISEVAMGKTVIIAVPSIQIMNQLKNSLNNINTIVINSELSTVSVIKQIYNLVYSDIQSTAIIISHQALLMSASVINNINSLRSRYSLEKLDLSFHIDEIPAVIDSISLPLVSNKGNNVTNAFDDIFNITTDNTLELVQGISKDTDLSPYTRNYQIVHNLISNAFAQAHILNVTDKQVNISLICTPDVIPDNSTIYTANYSTSLFKKIMESQGVKSNITSYSGIKTNQFSPNITITHVLDKNLTKYAKADKDWYTGLVSTMIDQITINSVDNQKALVLHNDSDTYDYESHNNLTKINHNSHGLNSYTDFNNIILTSTLNPSPYELDILSQYGISEEDIFLDRTINTFYQSIMRTSLRTTSDSHVNIIVASREIAYALKNNYFNMAKVSHVLYGSRVVVRKEYKPHKPHKQHKPHKPHKQHKERIDKTGFDQVTINKLNYIRKELVNYPEHVFNLISSLSDNDFVNSDMFKAISARGKIKDMSVFDNIINEVNVENEVNDNKDEDMNSDTIEGNTYDTLILDDYGMSDTFIDEELSNESQCTFVDKGYDVDFRTIKNSDLEVRLEDVINKIKNLKGIRWKCGKKTTVLTLL